MEIRVYRTHIKVFPYYKGQAESLEKRLSKWDRVNFEMIPMGYYIQDRILYLPRGINLSLLQLTFNAIPVIVSKSSNYSKIQNGVVRVQPRNRIQKEAIDFLISEGEFRDGRNYGQLSLNLDTGDGKTYTTINAILQYKIRTIIITHKESLKLQWIDEIFDKTTMKPEQILNIENSSMIKKIMERKIELVDIYLVNHQTLYSYAKTNGWNSLEKFFEKIRVGIKVFDEAHKFFHDCMMVDFFTNVEKTIYLTATFGRSEYSEDKIFKEAYSSVYRFGEETFSYEEKRKHIKFCAVFYNSGATSMDVAKVQTRFGFSSYKFIDYALSEENQTMMHKLDTILENVLELEGRIVITSPKISSTEEIASHVKKRTNKIVRTVHSKNEPKDNLEARKNADIISTTIKTMGEGDDIKGLRVLINLDPIGSKIPASQLRGRLREYAKDKDTFLIYFVDLSFSSIYNSYIRQVEPVMRKKCKDITRMNI